MTTLSKNIRSALGAAMAGAMVLGTLPVLAADKAPPIAFAVPRDVDMPKGEQGELIMYGKRLMSETKRLLPDNVGASMNCTSCHMAGGKAPKGSPFVGVSFAYPSYNPRAARDVTLAERFNGCFMRSMNGKPLDKESREMKAMIAYTDWLSSLIPQGVANVQGRGIGKVNAKLQPDPVNGKRVYEQQCAMCHGNDGEGMKDAQGEMLFPPLWGPESFNIGAGMARTYKAAAFVFNNMPVGHGLNDRLGQGGSLSEQEAVDVSEYFTHQPRPDFAGKANDWPKGDKPKDARY